MIVNVSETAKAVLVVDDDPDCRETLAAVLEGDGFRVETAGNGAQALESLRSPDRFGLILLDLMMPVMDGWEFRTRQLSDPRLAEIPVVITTGVPPDYQHLEQLQVAAAVLKPCRVESLLNLVERHCPRGGKAFCA